jgi:pimeloyl-ACP methyl ester carboxylesterase
MPKFCRLCPLALTVVALFSASALAKGIYTHGEAELEPAVLTVMTPSGIQQIPYELGTLYVREKRSNPRSRIIRVGFARIRSTAHPMGTPTFHLPGGPGNTILDRLQGPGNAELLQYLAVGDVLVLEQRGYTLRGEQLLSNFQGNPLPLDRPTSLTDITQSAVDLANASIAQYAGTEVDLSGYTILELADDVDDLRRALGYPKITLVGQSFGSQLSFAVMRRHPWMVKRALLSGVEPLNASYDMPSHVLAAIHRMASDIDKDPLFQHYLPRGGYMAAIGEIFHRLRRQPLNVQVTDPQTQQTFTVVLGVEDFQIFLNLAAENHQSIIDIYRGHYTHWAQQIAGLRVGGGMASFKLLIPWLIDTSTGVTPVRNRQLHTDPAIKLLGTWTFDPYIASAPIWPTRDVGNSLRTPMPSFIPVLFIAGDWDTSTPIENTRRIAPYFLNSRTLYVHRGTHGARSDIERTRPDVMAPILTFLKTGDTSQLPTKVELPAPWKMGLPPAQPPTP